MFDQALLNNNIEGATEVCQKVDQLLADIHIESNEYADFTRLNIYLLKNIFYEFFFYEGFTKQVESQLQIDYEMIIKKAGALEEYASSIVFKIVAWLELQKRPKEGLKMLNRMLQFYLDNAQKQKAFLLILFIMHYCENNDIKEINHDYLAQLLDDLARQMNEKESTLNQLNVLTIQKYEKLLIMIETFDVETTFKQRDLKFLKMLFLLSIPVKERDRFKQIQDLRFYCYIFNEDQHFKNIQLIDEQISKVKYAPKQRMFLNRLKWTATHNKRFMSYSGNYYVLKFNYRSKGYKFRYFKISRNYFAIVNEKNKDKIFTDLSEHGVCRLIRQH